MFTAKSEKDLQMQVAQELFADYAVSQEDKRIDFLVYSPGSLVQETFLWAEVKYSETDITKMFTQLLLTVKPMIDKGKMPPKFLGVFDKEKMVFLEYRHILALFNENDFNWHEKPSSPSEKAQKSVAKYLTDIIRFNFQDSDKELRTFIKENFRIGRADTAKAQINKNNFVLVYQKWLAAVRPSIVIKPEDQREYGLVDGDFYLADLLSENNFTIGDALKVLLRDKFYKLNVPIQKKMLFEEIGFKNNGKAHREFWEKYERPPKEEFHEYIKSRRDLLVPQDVRERKGAYYTPKIWVEKAQDYLAQEFGENWQEEYYVWDCCCGTGNLLAGLVNKHNIWASTLDRADVDVVHDLIDHGFNLLKSHVFQFDFLNGSFDDLPDSLKAVIRNPKKQKKLVIFINPPYVEARGETVSKSNKSGFNLSQTRDKFLGKIGNAVIEVFAQFMARIYEELSLSKLAIFGKLKYVNAPNFAKFRQYFQAEYKRGFIVLASTFNNVKGQFPIGFLIWDLENKKGFKKITTDVFNARGNKLRQKSFYIPNQKNQLINDWVKTFFSVRESIATIIGPAADFQHQQNIWIIAPDTDSNWFHWQIGKENLNDTAIYFAVRHCIKATWIIDRDQFLYPKEDYKNDKRFRDNCLIYTLFHEKNKIKSEDGTNHWIPFTAHEVDAKDNFTSSFMSNFLKENVTLTPAAKTVYNAGKALWSYYHATIRNINRTNVDASLYEIREYFKERNENGRLNTKSADENFNELDKALREAVKRLAEEIQPKVYEYGFLME